MRIGGLRDMRLSRRSLLSISCLQDLDRWAIGMKLVEYVVVRAVMEFMVDL